jgi:hypothetical protein
MTAKNTRLFRLPIAAAALLLLSVPATALSLPALPSLPIGEELPVLPVPDVSVQAGTPLGDAHVTVASDCADIDADLSRIAPIGAARAHVCMADELEGAQVCAEAYSAVEVEACAEAETGARSTSAKLGDALKGIWSAIKGLF